MARCKDCSVGLLGACNGDYCRVEREVLFDEARRMAQQRGHELGTFDKAHRTPVWTACCTHCRRCASVTLDPEPGQSDVWGDALTLGCTGQSQSPDD